MYATVHALNLHLIFEHDGVVLTFPRLDLNLEPCQPRRIDAPRPAPNRPVQLIKAREGAEQYFVLVFAHGEGTAMAKLEVALELVYADDQTPVPLLFNVVDVSAFVQSLGQAFRGQCVAQGSAVEVVQIRHHFTHQGEAASAWHPIYMGEFESAMKGYPTTARLYPPLPR